MSPTPPQTAAIILAAGASTRLGRPKQTVVLAGETLLARAFRIASEAGLAPVIAVVSHADLTPPLGAQVLLNPRAYEGMSTSIVTGITRASAIGAAGAVLMTCDQVALTAEHLRALCAHPTQRTGSAYAGRIGIPAYFPATDFPALLALTGDTGARDLLRHAPSIPAEPLALDIDTEADLTHARNLFER